MEYNSTNSYRDCDLFNILNEPSHLQTSNYYTVDQIKDLNYEKSDLNILHINIRSLVSKKDNLCSLMKNLENENYSIDVILVCETFMNDNNHSMCNIDGYNMECKYRKNKSQGGVAIYISEKLNYTNRPEIGIFLEGTIESNFIEIQTGKNSQNIVIGEIYRVPGTSEKLFLEEYSKILKTLAAEKVDIIIGTDQNMDLLKLETNENVAKLFDICLENFMLPTITKPTRITRTNASLIDNIYISKNLQQNFRSAIIVESLSDHLACLTLIKSTKVTKHTTSISTYRNLCEANLQLIDTELMNQDWSVLLNKETNNAYDLFSI